VIVQHNPSKSSVAPSLNEQPALEKNTPLIEYSP
jgi:hypothetical protein